MPTTTPPTILDRAHQAQELFDAMAKIVRRLDDDFPELDGDADLSGADAVDRITDIRREAKDIVGRLTAFNDQVET
jgi:hypothetical protein